MGDLLASGLITLGITLGIMTVLLIGGFIADYILPHISLVNRFLNGLPLWNQNNNSGKEKRFEQTVICRCVQTCTKDF